MANFSKFNDIEAVMNKASSSLPAIEQEYTKYLQVEKIPDDFLVDIKDYLANLRTALDFLWYKIPNISGDHFPVANSKADFTPKVSGIEAQIATVMEDAQDYNPNGWLRCFNLFRNKNVHLTLVPQKRIETPALKIEHNGVGMTLSGGASIRIGNGASISLGGAQIMGGQTISPNSGRLYGDPRIQVRKEIWIDFLFDGSSISSDFPAGISALPFLKRSLESVAKIISKVEQVL